MKIALAALLPLLVLSPDAMEDARPDVAVRGPYHFALPVPDLKAADAEAVSAALLAEFDGREIFDIKVQDGVVEFYAGGEGPEHLLHLSRVERGLATAGFSLHRRPWNFPSQALGLVVESKSAVGGPALKDAVAQLDGASVIGTLLDGNRMVLVVEFEKSVSWAELSKGLAKSDVSIDDIVWGHWKHGWQMEPQHDAHDCGAVL